ncbi:hypothetical protein C3L50_06030 [Flavobacterium alvei]|uniref:Uncharacterized protein n=1 Tax=Flavobacterium alvei TaxID=2080416 RepID=A0A2S5ADN1_9FLAO|nr:hypothetical protein C3L50_06030 [Flavobacterium alvei]
MYDRNNFFYLKKNCNLAVPTKSTITIYFFVVFKCCLTIKKHAMKTLFDKFYNYISTLLFGGETTSHY